MPNPEPPATDAHPDPVADRPEADSPAAPTIPSFASLRAPRRRTAVDVLMPDSSPGSWTDPSPGSWKEPEPVSPGPGSESESEPESWYQPLDPGPAPVSTPRPAEYGDLLRLGMHAVRALAGLPLRLAGRVVREPATCLRRLLGH